MKNYVLLFCILAATLGLRSQSLTLSVTPAVCFNPSSPSTNTTAANVTSTLSGITNYTWYIVGTSSSSCIGTYTATNSTASNVVISYPCCGLYTVSCTAYNGTLAVDFTYSTVTVHCNNIYLYSPTNFASCNGSSVSMFAYGGSSNVWSNGSGTISSSYSVAVSPTVNTCYTVVSTSTVGCTYTSVACVTVSGSPTVNITGISTNTNNCYYTSYTMTASGATSYSWYPSYLGTNATATAWLGASPCYTVVGSNGGACTAVAVHCPTVTGGSSLSITASPSKTVCAGSTVTLGTSSAASNYTWSNNGGTLGNNSTAAVTPTNTSSMGYNIYSVTVTYSNGCTGYASIFLYLYNTSALPISATGGTQFCIGQTRTLSTSASGPYSWSDGNSVISTASSVVVSPTASTCYTLSASTQSCTGTGFICLALVSPPSFSANTTNINCYNQGLYITPQGASFYSLPGYSLTNGSFFVNPTTSTCYTLTGWNVPGCTSTAVACATVWPSVVHTGSNTVLTICAGQSVSLGTSSVPYNWYIYSPATSYTGTNLVVSPSATTIYSVSVGLPYYCPSGFTSTVIVNQNPTVSVIGNHTVCAGSSLTIQGTGANSYTWTQLGPGGLKVVTPTADTCYHVTGTSPGGCTATAVHCVSVMNVPVIISPASATVCEGSSHTFTASGGTGYLWSNSSTTNTINVLPSVSTSYTVTGSGSNGCSGTAVASLVIDTTCTDVWPGDANSDGVVGTSDVLEIGLAYNATGSARTPGGNNYTAQYATNWSGTISSGKNKCHADCNGDGTIDDDDTLAIYNNFALTHAFRSSSAGNDIRVVSDENYFTAGTWNKADIYAGDGQNTMLLYGLTFDLSFDNTLVETDEAYLVYTSSFLNSNNQNVEFRKRDFNAGKVYAASVRTDFTNVSGTGKIAELHFKIKPGTEGQFMALAANNSERIDKDGNHTDQAGNNILVEIRVNDVGLAERHQEPAFSLVPNPANDRVTLNYPSTNVITYEITDVSGRTLINGVFSGTGTIDTSALPSGVYMITCRSEALNSTQRLIIQR